MLRVGILIVYNVTTKQNSASPIFILMAIAGVCLWRVDSFLPPDHYMAMIVSIIICMVLLGLTAFFMRRRAPAFERNILMLLQIKEYIKNNPNYEWPKDSDTPSGF